MKKFVFLLIFFTLTPITLVIALFGLVKFYPPLYGRVLSAESTLPQRLFAALPPQVGSMAAMVGTDDARPEIIRQYLEEHNSPMLPYADFLFAMAQKYKLDYRLMIAIAQCESNLCKRSPPGSYNCWGFENGATRFLSWEQAIEQVAKTLKEGYIDKGLITPEEIMPKYAPPSVEKGGPWAICVNQFLEELE